MLAKQWERIAEVGSYREARRLESETLVAYHRAERRRQLGERLSRGDREALKLRGTRIKRCGKDRSRFAVKAWYGAFRAQAQVSA